MGITVLKESSFPSIVLPRRMRLTKMGFYAVIVTIRIIIQVCSTALQISVRDGDASLTIATADIVDRCFASSKRSSELLMVVDQTSDDILRTIHRRSKTANLIVSLESTGNREYTESEKSNAYVDPKIEFEGQRSKPVAVAITAYGVTQLQSILGFLKNDLRRSWQPGSYFLVILDHRCNLEECNNMFKVIWKYWILNAVILCSASDPAHQNDRRIELYTFNPYSADHSLRWETMIHETVEVSISPGNFNHSWYIFKRRFTDIKSFEDCGELFFDKTSNLDGYVIPIANPYPEHLLAKTNITITAEYFAADRQLLATLTKALRFKVAEIRNNETLGYGRYEDDGSYSGIMAELYKKRAHFAPYMCPLSYLPGLLMTYPHELSGICLASRIAGNWPQWTNLAAAKHIWITLGLGLIYATVTFYVQNKSHGIVSAFLDAQRFIIGNSIIRVPTGMKHRTILGSLFLVFLVIDGVIRGRFISILTVPRPYAEIETLDQVREQSVEVFGHREYNRIFRAWLNVQMAGNLGIAECLDSLIKVRRRRVCAIDCQQVQLQPRIPNIHRSTVRIWSHYQGFITAMHWPMKDRYSSELQKLVEAGMIEKWKSNLRRELEVDSWKLNRAADPPFVKPTQLNDLLPAFALLAIGLSTALIVFAWEIRGSMSLPRCLICQR